MDARAAAVTKPASFRLRFLDGRLDGITVLGPTGRIEFRGPQYHEWLDDVATLTSPFYRLHAALTGPHASVLHAGDVLDVYVGCEDLAAVTELYNQADMEIEWTSREQP